MRGPKPRQSSVSQSNREALEDTARRWSAESGFTLRYRTLGEQISRSSVQRILSAEGLRPHRVRQWVHSPDPDFTTKVQRICDIYLDPPEDAVVLCIDEKPIQALRRCYPKHISAGGFVREEFEYKRKGVRHLLAAFDIRTGRVIGQMVKHRGAKAMVSFLDHVARRHPGQPIIIVRDNLNIHCDGKELRWTRFNERHGGRFTFVPTLLHASWVNQVEIWFSILQGRVLRNGSFDSLDMLSNPGRKTTPSPTPAFVARPCNGGRPSCPPTRAHGRRCLPACRFERPSTCFAPTSPGCSRLSSNPERICDLSH